MAKLITSMTFCADRMTPGEKRVAQRLETHLSDDCLVWYDIPVGRNYRHPDFVIIDPAQGLIFLEVKDWQLSTLQQASSQTVTLDTDNGPRQMLNPLEQVRQYACDTINQLSGDPRLQQVGKYAGKLNLGWAYGVIFTNITRRQLNSLSSAETMEAVFPERLTLCQDEIAGSVSPAAFQHKISEMFTTAFKPVVTPERRDILRQHLFPEIVIPVKKSNSDLHKVMDMQQEILARNMGEGHRIIHGVAGSGKTLILLYRCLYLAENTTRPILVLCFNITLASYLRECIAARGLTGRIHIYHFHGWCAAMARKNHLKVSTEGNYGENCFVALKGAVEAGDVSDVDYDAVLIDEGHDFDQSWLRLIARLFDNDTRSLLLMYDDAQTLYRRDRGLNFSLSSVGIQAQGRSSILRINYRNTKNILNFAYTFSREYFEKHHNQEIPQVFPQACGEAGAMPEVVHCHNTQDEIRHVMSWLRQKYTRTGRWGDIAVLCPAAFSVDGLCDEMSHQGIPFAAGFGDSGKRNYSHRQNAVHLLTFQSSKGLEFPFVAVMNASFVHQHAEEEASVIPALYVAFTRATSELLVTCYRVNSISHHLEQAASRLLTEMPASQVADNGVFADERSDTF